MRRRRAGRRDKKNVHQWEKMTHDNWKHVSRERQECVCISSIIVTTTIGAALSIWFVLAEKVF